MNPPPSLNRARSLRSRSTAAEDGLWSHLRNRQLGGLKFVRQAPIGAYFADFLCRERKVIVEVDGGTHSTAAEIARDAARSSYLKARGYRYLKARDYRIFRAHNDEISENIDGVLDTLLGFIELKGPYPTGVPAAAPHPDPLPPSGERDSKALRS